MIEQKYSYRKMNKFFTSTTKQNFIFLIQTSFWLQFNWNIKRQAWKTSYFFKETTERKCKDEIIFFIHVKTNTRLSFEVQLRFEIFFHLKNTNSRPTELSQVSKLVHLLIKSVVDENWKTYLLRLSQVRISPAFDAGMILARLLRCH